MGTQQTFEVQHGKMIYPFITTLDPTDDALIEGMKRRAEVEIREKALAANPGYDVIYVKAVSATSKLGYIENRDFMEGGEPMDYLIIDVAFAVAPTP